MAKLAREFQAKMVEHEAKLQSLTLTKQEAEHQAQVAAREHDDYDMGHGAKQGTGITSPTGSGLKGADGHTG